MGLNFAHILSCSPLLDPPLTPLKKGGSQMLLTLLVIGGWGGSNVSLLNPIGIIQTH
jgi:hypothetical protein